MTIESSIGSIKESNLELREKDSLFVVIGYFAPSNPMRRRRISSSSQSEEKERKEAHKIEKIKGK